MLSILSNLFSLFSVLAWMLALILGIVALVTGYQFTFRPSAIVARREDWAKAYCLRTALFAAVLSLVSVILLVLTGGGTNAL